MQSAYMPGGVEISRAWQDRHLRTPVKPVYDNFCYLKGKQRHSLNGSSVAINGIQLKIGLSRFLELLISYNVDLSSF
jgi:hypothetical protein